MNDAPKLLNIGPKSAAWLRQVGIRSREQLVEAGALGAFIKIKRAGFRPGLNLLYALEGAIRECHWREVPEQRRTELLVAA
jgi:DNA transformation protein and related proteins